MEGFPTSLKLGGSFVVFPTSPTPSGMGSVVPSPLVGSGTSRHPPR